MKYTSASAKPMLATSKKATKLTMYKSNESVWVISNCTHKQSVRSSEKQLCHSRFIPCKFSQFMKSSKVVTDKLDNPEGTYPF